MLAPYPLGHALHVGLATSFDVMYLPDTVVTWNVGVGHALPLYVIVFDVIPLQLLGVDGVGAVNLHAVFDVDPASELNVPDVYPLG